MNEKSENTATEYPIKMKRNNLLLPHPEQG